MARRAALFAVAAALALVACGGNEATMAASGGSGAPYQLTFRGDGTFDAYSGKALRAALYVKTPRQLVEVRQTTVASGSPAFSITFVPTLDPATQYHLHYWIDVDGDGVCDPPDVDAQWSVDPPLGQATFEVTYRPADVSDVCGSFQ